MPDYGTMWYDVTHLVRQMSYRGDRFTDYVTVCDMVYARTKVVDVEHATPTCLECLVRMGRKFCCRCDTELHDWQLPMDIQERCEECDT